MDDYAGLAAYGPAAGNKALAAQPFVSFHRDSGGHGCLSGGILGNTQAAS